jgi:hypothetical protein
VANFAVLRKVDFMANLASGATVSCEVNRFLMNVLFSNYKNLHEKGSITEKQLLDELTFNSKVMLHRYMSASSENKGDFDTSQTSGEWGLGSPEFESLLNGSKPPPGVIGLGEHHSRSWLSLPFGMSSALCLFRVECGQFPDQQPCSFTIVLPNLSSIVEDGLWVPHRYKIIMKKQIVGWKD